MKPLSELNRAQYLADMRSSALRMRGLTHPVSAHYYEFSVRVDYAASALKNAMFYRDLARGTREAK